MPDTTTLIVLAAALLATVLVAREVMGRFKTVKVFEYQQGLRYVNGKFEGLLGPGGYRIYTPTTSIWIVDMRATLVTVPGQELVSSDGVTVKMSLSVQQRLADPVLATHGVQNASDAVYAELQVALREVATAMTIDEILAQRDEVGARVLEKVVEPALAVGIEVIAVDVRDLMLPAATKRLFNQVVEARQKGLAALEKARGETAALRSLANAARMVEANPSLLQLRILQQLESSSGNTILLGMPPGSTPVPIREVGAGEELSAAPETPDAG